jgi:hypothetical protein
LVAARRPGKSKRRICGDYRLINDCCHLHAFPVKHAGEAIRQFKGSKHFSKADLSKGHLEVTPMPAFDFMLAAGPDPKAHRVLP